MDARRLIDEVIAPHQRTDPVAYEKVLAAIEEDVLQTGADLEALETKLRDLAGYAESLLAFAKPAALEEPDWPWRSLVELVPHRASDLADTTEPCWIDGPVGAFRVAPWRLEALELQVGEVVIEPATAQIRLVGDLHAGPGKPHPPGLWVRARWQEDLPLRIRLPLAWSSKGRLRLVWFPLGSARVFLALGGMAHEGSNHPAIEWELPEQPTQGELVVELASPLRQDGAWKEAAVWLVGLFAYRAIHRKIGIVESRPVVVDTPVYQVQVIGDEQAVLPNRVEYALAVGDPGAPPHWRPVRSGEIVEIVPQLGRQKTLWSTQAVGDAIVAGKQIYRIDRIPEADPRRIVMYVGVDQWAVGRRRWSLTDDPGQVLSYEWLTQTAFAPLPYRRHTDVGEQGIVPVGPQEAVRLSCVVVADQTVLSAWRYRAEGIVTEMWVNGRLVASASHSGQDVLVMLPLVTGINTLDLCAVNTTNQPAYLQLLEPLPFAVRAHARPVRWVPKDTLLYEAIPNRLDVAAFDEDGSILQLSLPQGGSQPAPASLPWLSVKYLVQFTPRLAMRSQEVRVRAVLIQEDERPVLLRSVRLIGS